MMFLLPFILFSFHHQFAYANSTFCPQLDPPCSCISSTFEPINIRCSSAPNLIDILKSLSPAKNLLKIDSLIINGTRINILPPKVFRGLNIVRLSLRKTDLTDFDPVSFDGPLLESIMELDLTDNNLTRIPINSISMFKNLRKLSLSKNQISILQPDSFCSYESRHRLTTLDLSFNKIEILDPNSISALRNLQELNLQGNRMVQVPTVALRRVKWTLKHLNLALNPISYIQPFTFDLPNLESLSLEYNELAHISPEAFHGVPNLMYLYLTGNKLVRLESELFRYLCRLRNLGMGGNAITHIPWNAFSRLPHLLRLEMSDGMVSAVDTRAFQSARCLQAIILNNNKLTEISMDMFQGLTDLYTLDLSGNAIKTISDGAFAYLPNLKHLDLSGNQLETIEPRTFENTFMASSDTKVLYLCRNLWICNDTMDIFRRWLRENVEIVIDKPDCAAVCKEPDWLTNWPIRFPNPPPPNDTDYLSFQNWPGQNQQTLQNSLAPPVWPPPFLPTSMTPAQSVWLPRNVTSTPPFGSPRNVTPAPSFWLPTHVTPPSIWPPQNMTQAPSIWPPQNMTQAPSIWPPQNMTQAPSIWPPQNMTQAPSIWPPQNMTQAPSIWPPQNMTQAPSIWPPQNMTQAPSIWPPRNMTPNPQENWLTPHFPQTNLTTITPISSTSKWIPFWSPPTDMHPTLSIPPWHPTPMPTLIQITAPPVFARLQRNPEKLDESEDYKPVQASIPELPSFTQLLFGRVPGSIGHFLKSTFTSGVQSKNDTITRRIHSTKGENGRR